MGLIGHSRRLQNGIYQRATSNKSKKNFSPEKCKLNAEVEELLKKDARDGSNELNSGRFLQHLFPGAKKEQENVTGIIS